MVWCGMASVLEEDWQELTSADVEAFRSTPNPYAEAAHELSRNLWRFTEKVAQDALAAGHELHEIRDITPAPSGTLVHRLILVKPNREYALITAAWNTSDMFEAPSAVVFRMQLLTPSMSSR